MLAYQDIARDLKTLALTSDPRTSGVIFEECARYGYLVSAFMTKAYIMNNEYHFNYDISPNCIYREIVLY